MPEEMLDIMKASVAQIILRNLMQEWKKKGGE